MCCSYALQSTPCLHKYTLRSPNVTTALHLRLRRLCIASAPPLRVSAYPQRCNCVASALHLAASAWPLRCLCAATLPLLRRVHAAITALPRRRLLRRTYTVPAAPTSRQHPAATLAQHSRTSPSAHACVLAPHSAAPAPPHAPLPPPLAPPIRRQYTAQTVASTPPHASLP
jgi:hypothetical protein